MPGGSPPATRPRSRAAIRTNTPANLAKWISDPTSIDPLTAMPDVDVTYDDARHIAAYLYTLEQGVGPPPAPPPSS